MDSLSVTIAAALIGGAATMGAAVYSVRARRAKPKFDQLPRSERDFLTGRWKGHWNVIHPPDRVEDYFSDSIEFHVAPDGRLWGKGVGPEYGDYLLEGRAWHYALTIQYKGAADGDERVGVVLLEKDVMNRTMTGEWSQLAAGNIVIRGEVRWEKINQQ